MYLILYLSITKPIKHYKGCTYYYSSVGVQPNKIHATHD